MGVGKKNLKEAFLDFPPPGPVANVGTFPLMLKFHKVWNNGIACAFLASLHAPWGRLQVGGSTIMEALWRNIRCDEDGLARAWRGKLCGTYNTHKNLMFVRGGLPACSLAPDYIVVALFRRPLDKLVSTLYWYAPDRLRGGHPWTSYIGNWTVADVRFMLSTLSQDRNPLLQPPLQEYTAVLGGLGAHRGWSERQRWASGAGAGTGGGGDALVLRRAESESNLVARRAALARLRSDPELVVGLAERMDAAALLVALRLGWAPRRMAFRSMKDKARLRPGDARYNPRKANPNAGLYHRVSPSARQYADFLLRDDDRIYAAAAEVHERQAAAFPDFAAELLAFRADLERGPPGECQGG